MTDEIKQKDDGKKGAFYVEDDGQTLAQMTYVHSSEDKIIIDHTEVSDVLRGQNTGRKLLDKVVEYARQNNYKILPLCPFAKAMMMKNRAQFEDVLV